MNFTSSDWMAIRLTLELASLTTLLLVLLGTPVAWWLSRTNSRAKPVIVSLVAMPLVLPPSVIGFYLLVFMGPHGPLGQLTQSLGLGTLPFTFGGLLFASCIYSLPFVVQPLHNAFEAIDERMYEAAATLRAGPLDRYGAGGAYNPATGTLYVSHGFTSDGRYDDTWGYELGGSAAGWHDDSATGARPDPRCLVRTIVDSARGRLLLFGGQSNSASFLGDFWTFDLTTHTWTQLSGGPSARNLYSWTLRDGTDTALLFGGATGSGDSNQLWALDLATDTWRLVPASGASPAPRNSHDAVWLAGRQALFVFGGHAAGGDINEIWLAVPE